MANRGSSMPATDAVAKTSGSPLAGGANETWLPQDAYAAYLRSLTHTGESVFLPHGVQLFSQGQIDHSFYVVVTGKVHVHTISEGGHESILNIMGPGSVIGEAAALLQQPRYSSARAIEDTTLLRFEASRVLELVRQDPNFAMALLYLLSIKQRQLVARLRQVIFDPPEQRVLQFFEQFRQTHTEAQASQGPVTVNLTHEQIGNLTDLSRVTVTRVLGKLKRAGLIDFDKKKVVLADGFAGGQARMHAGP